MKMIATLSAALVAGSVFAMPAGFTTDYEGALKRAAERNVPTLVLFTGSDWCGWCIRLEKEVFSKPEFTEAATNKFELVFCDFPMKTKPPAEIAKKNQELQQKYGVRGFPTIVALDPKGEEVARLGYRPGDATQWLEYAAREVALGPLVSKYFKTFENDFESLRTTAIKAMQKSYKAMMEAKDDAEKEALRKSITAEATTLAQALKTKLTAAELPAELVEKKDAMLKVVNQILSSLEKDPQAK